VFGYVVADKPNMLMKDYAAYRAYYCGLCKTLGLSYTPVTRFTVNYDIAFLTLLAHNYRKVTPEFKDERCIAHPVGKRFPVVQNNPVQKDVADINIILGYYKSQDDVLDGGSGKHRAARAFLKNKYKRAAKRFPALAKSVGENYAKLNALEKEREENLDKLANCFANIMVDVGRAAANNADELLDSLCYNLGRWIYIIDAYDDLKRDIKEKKFNPLIPSGKFDESGEQAIYEKVKFNLQHAVGEIIAAYDAMDITVSEGAISNIIYCGLKARTNLILERRGAICKKTLL